jgi:hypothetical protein
MRGTPIVVSRAQLSIVAYHNVESTWRFPTTRVTGLAPSGARYW